MALLESQLFEETVMSPSATCATSDEERCGYGACSQCSCQAYMGSGDLCGNCHHNYSFHW
jgi:hypothetical protein